MRINSLFEARRFWAFMRATEKHDQTTPFTSKCLSQVSARSVGHSKPASTQTSLWPNNRQRRYIT